MKKLLIIIFAMSLFLVAQEAEKKFNFGSETDFVPFLTGGYYSSMWISYDNFRLRSVLADVNMPKFMTPDKFKDYEVKINAFIVDYFFDKNLQGFWLALGIEFWKSRASEKETSITGKFNSTVFTLGGGYVIDIWNNIYINPWAAVHYGSQENNLLIGSNNFKEKRLVPEFSVKLGYRF
ncbi:MAG: hypothetical protein ACEPO8_04410 [Rhodothermaceae bacterium]